MKYLVQETKYRDGRIIIHKTPINNKVGVSFINARIKEHEFSDKVDFMDVSDNFVFVEFKKGLVQYKLWTIEEID